MQGNRGSFSHKYISPLETTEIVSLYHVLYTMCCTSLRAIMVLPTKNTDLVKSCIKGYKKSQSGPSAYKIVHLSNLIHVYTYDNIAIKLLCLAVYFHDLEAEDNGFLYSIHYLHTRISTVIIKKISSWRSEEKKRDFNCSASKLSYI